MADNHGNIVDRLSSLVNGVKGQRRVQRETENDEDIDECLSRCLVFPCVQLPQPQSVGAVLLFSLLFWKRKLFPASDFSASASAIVLAVDRDPGTEIGSEVVNVS